MVGYARRRPLLACGWLTLLAVVATACSTRVSAPPEPPQSLRNGDEAFHYGQYQVAITSYRAYLEQHPEDAYTPRAYYKTALAEYRLGKYPETLSTLDELRLAYPDTRWVQVEALRGDAYREMGKPILAIQAWDKAWPMGNDEDQGKLRQRIIAVVRGLNERQLQAARKSVLTRDVAAMIDNQIAVRKTLPPAQPTPKAAAAAALASRGNPAPTAAQAEGASWNVPVAPPSTVANPTAAAASPEPETPQPGPPAAGAPAAALPVTAAPEPPAAAGAGQLAAIPPEEEVTVMEGGPTEPGGQPRTPVAEALARPAADSPPTHVEVVAKVGCLLPLSGAVRELGERSLRGIRLVFGEDTDQLVVKDTAGDVATALSRFSELAGNPDVKVVIGPIRGDDAERVAGVAEKAQLPVLLLSQRDGLDGRYALQVGMTRSRMLGTLLDYAMGTARIRRIGILYPANVSGKELLAAVRHEVAQRGGTIVGTQSYSPQTRALTLDTIQKWRDQKHVQGIFLADTATAAEGFARYLEQEMPDVTLLGIHGWEGLATGSTGEGEGINGLLFIDSFYAAGDRPGTRQFVALYERTYGEPPGTIEAQAYDAALLAKRALATGALTRADVAQELHTLGPLNDAAGDLVATPAGIQRRLFLLRVFDGKLKAIGSS